MRILLLSGGGLKGAVALPILEHLHENEQPFDMVIGVSIGSINGALFAQGDIDLMKDIWNDIDDKHPLFGTKGFLSFALYRGKALYSLKPVENKLKEFVSLDKIKTPFAAGVTFRHNRQYQNLLTGREIKSTDQLHTAILGSSAISGLMEPYEFDFDGQKTMIADGGHRFVLPRYYGEATHITAVFCDRIDQQVQREMDIKNNFFANIGFTLDTMEDKCRIDDFQWVKSLSNKCDIRVYAPKVDIGNLLDASRNTIKNRIDIGYDMLHNPLTFGPEKK